MVRGVLKKEGRVLIDGCYQASHFFDRFMGLMGRRSLPSTEGVYFPKCNSIHTCFMWIPIDVLFVSKDGSVIEVCNQVKPWRFLLPRTKADAVIEMAAGMANGLGIDAGDKLEWERSSQK